MPDPDDALTQAARYWARRWLEDDPEHGPDWTVEGPQRPRAFDRAETLIHRSPRTPPRGPVRDQLLARRRLAGQDLECLDQQLRALLTRRRRLTERLEATTLALTGTARVLPAPDPAIDPPVTIGTGRPNPPSLSGRRLRRAAVALVRAAEIPLDLGEIQRLLALQGLAIARRPSQTLSNALRPAVARGELVRLASGTYAPRATEAT